MGEWVLVLALNIASGTPGEIRDVSLSTVGGFTSKSTCEAAGKSMPVLNYECVFVKK